MATIRTTYKYKCDLDKGTMETSLRNSLMQADALADAFAVTVQRNGADVDISGMTAYGYLYANATKTTVPLKGTVSGSTATVILSEDCYAVSGYASLMIQLHDGDVRHTVLKVDFVVTRTGGTLVLDGDNILPTLAELLGQIAAMEQATAEAREALGQLPITQNSYQTHYVLENTDIDAMLATSGKVADAKVTGDKINVLTEEIGYLQYIAHELINDKCAQYTGYRLSTFSGANAMVFDVRNVRKFLYAHTIASPDLRGLYFVDMNGAPIIGYQTLETAQEISVPDNAVTCYATVNTAGDILCYDIYGSLNKLSDAVDDATQSVTQMEDALQGEKPVEILKDQASYSDKTSGGVTYTWSDDHKEVHISGTRTSTSFNKMAGSTNGLPEGIVPGKMYTFDINPVNSAIVLALLEYVDGTNTYMKTFSMPERYTIPEDCTGLEIRLQVIGNGAVVDETITCPAIYTIPERIGLAAQVKKLEAEVYKDTQNPLAEIKRSPGLLSLFHTVGCIGDSLSSGECAHNEDGTKHYIDLYDFSWGQCLARMTGNKYYNFSKGGLTTKTWLASSYATECFDGEHLCDAYFIGLGQNDKNVSMTVGTTADIDMSDYNNNADTYCGNYGKIIQRLREVQPKAPIFMFVDPNPPKGDQAYNNVLPDIASLFDNVYLIDLKTYAAALYTSKDEVIGSQLRSGHYSALGYQEMAYVIATYVDWIVRNNISDFSQIEFIGTDYEWID